MQHCVKVTYAPKVIWVDADDEEEAESLAREKIDEDWLDSDIFEYEVVEILED